MYLFQFDLTPLRAIHRYGCLVSKRRSEKAERGAMNNKPDRPPRPGKRNRGTSSCPPRRTASATGAEQVDPSEAAVRLGLSEAALFALWRNKSGPRNIYSGNEFRFLKGDLATFSEEARSQAFQRRLRSITAAKLDHPLWHRISENLDTLQAASPKTAGN